MKKKEIDIPQGFRGGLVRFFNSAIFARFIIALILFNGAILGIQTYPGITKLYGKILNNIDDVILYIFMVELAFKFIAYGPKFFKDGWNIFDVLVVALSFASNDDGAFSVLRAVRIFRVFRLISASEALRNVVEGFVRAIPGLGSISSILMIVFYIFSVVATKLFGEAFPEFFGTLQTSLFSLFQIMTLEGWPDLARTVMKTYPYAWVFFVSYILIVTFSVLNLFIAVIVDAMQKQTSVNADDQEEEDLRKIQKELQKLNKKLDGLKLEK